MTTRIWKFNKDSNADITNIEKSLAFKIRNKIDNGEKLNRDEKNYITEACRSNSYSRSGIPTLGWMINFSDILTKYLVKYSIDAYNDAWYEVNSVDITSLRKSSHSKIYKIIKL